MEVASSVKRVVFSDIKSYGRGACDATVRKGVVKVAGRWSCRVVTV